MNGEEVFEVLFQFQLKAVGCGHPAPEERVGAVTEERAL
jgi:hypothetical protein